MRLPDPPAGLPWALYALCGSSLLFNALLFAKLMTNGDAPDAPVNTGPEIAAAVVELPEGVEAGVAVVEEEAPHASLAAATANGQATETKVVHSKVKHSLARTFQNAVDPAHANVVAAVFARNFFWDLDLRRDLQRGDEVALAYTWDGELAHIPVATYRSSKLGATLSAYNYQAAADPFPSYWDAEGREVGRRLNDSPLANYEQITSLLKDRPSHKGMDFKTPVGTEIVSPRPGKVTRTNWNFKYNGNCVEVRYRDGHVAKFLHLSETAVTPGQRVAAGERLGATGNTGRSTAPHLHYELEKNGRVVDPVDYHGTYRRQLSADEIETFQAEKAELDAVLASAQG